MAENENMDDTLSSSEKFNEESTQNDKSSKRSYKQIYRKDWESNPIFKGWLSPVPCDKHKAECTACRKELLAHRLTLLKHASSAKHLKRVAASRGADTREIIHHEEQMAAKAEDSPTVLSELTSYDPSEDVHLSASEISHLSQIGATETVESVVTHEVPSTSEENLTNIIIQAGDQYVDISDSSEAINFKQGYMAGAKAVVGSCSGGAEKSNTTSAILSCTAAAFISEKMDGSAEDGVINKITTYPLQISTRVTDYSRGVSVANLNITLYKLASGKWIGVAESITDEVGRCNLFPKNEPYFSVGCYKLHYDVATYYEIQNMKSYFPFIEISFLIRSPNESHHIPLMVSPNGYTAYRSLDF